MLVWYGGDISDGGVTGQSPEKPEGKGWCEGIYIIIERQGGSHLSDERDRMVKGKERLCLCELAALMEVHDIRGV